LSATIRKAFLTLAFGTMVTTAACGGSDGDPSLEVAWTFASGDCASNGVETVRVTWGPLGGQTEDVEFSCEEGHGTLGSSESGGYSIDAEGLDANGVAVVESYGVSTMFSGAAPGVLTVDITLRPKGVDVVVSWSITGGGVCPDGVILPYFITLYDVLADPGANEIVAEAQESCSAGQATLPNIAPGDYIVEVDSRAATPLLRATVPFTVEAGQDAQVSVMF
jgi:hypothetical protein